MRPGGSSGRRVSTALLMDRRHLPSRVLAHSLQFTQGYA
jgi:hypothetical protein